MYLSTTDYVQHKFAPGSDGADAFYAMMDSYLGQLDAAGAVIVLTADHGMKDKHGSDGQPDVLYLQDLLDDWLGERAIRRVILPITDPYVVHHGALGSFATVYLPKDAWPTDDTCRPYRQRLKASTQFYNKRETGCARLRTAGGQAWAIIIVVSRDTKVLGTTREPSTTFQASNEPLRSHGGITEQEVPDGGQPQGPRA